MIPDDEDFDDGGPRAPVFTTELDLDDPDAEIGPIDPLDLVKAQIDAEPLDVAPDTAPDADPCPKCGAGLDCDLDTDSPLSVSVRYLWTCGKCGFSESRQEPEAKDDEQREGQAGGGRGSP